MRPVSALRTRDSALLRVDDRAIGPAQHQIAVAHGRRSCRVRGRGGARYGPLGGERRGAVECAGPETSRARRSDEP